MFQLYKLKCVLIRVKGYNASKRIPYLNEMSMTSTNVRNETCSVFISTCFVCLLLIYILQNVSNMKMFIILLILI